MQRLSTVALIVALSGCVPPQPPTPPPTWPLIVHVVDDDGPVAGIPVDIEDGPSRGRVVTTNAAGDAHFGALPQAGQTVCAGDDRYVRACEPATLNRPLTVTVRVTPVPPPAPAPLPRLRLEGRRLVREDGTRFNYQAITSFGLAWQESAGRAGEVRALLADYAALGFTAVRVLSTAINLFDLPPDVGRGALPALFADAARHGLYVEVVAVADSASRDYNWRAHARLVALACAAVTNCLYEFANEPYHGTQAEAIHDPADAQREAEAAVAGLSGLVWTVGPSADDEASTPQGAYLARHLNRDRDILNQARHFKDVAERAIGLGKFLINDEPTGARQRAPDVDPSADPPDCANTDGGGQRFWCASFFAALGVFEAGWGAGGTFHLQAGLRSTALSPDERTAAAAYLAGRAVIPPSEHGAWAFCHNAQGDCPVRASSGDPIFEDPAGGPIVRAFAWVSGDHGIVAVLHRPSAYPDVVPFGAGWSRQGAPVIQWPQFTVWRVTR